jgi:hypothetical protein
MCVLFPMHETQSVEIQRTCRVSSEVTGERAWPTIRAFAALCTHGKISLVWNVRSGPSWRGVRQVHTDKPPELEGRRPEQNKNSSLSRRSPRTEDMKRARDIVLVKMNPGNDVSSCRVM